MHWIYLALAIIAEVIATSYLKSSQSFTQIIPTIISIVGYTASVYLLSLTLETLTIGIAYAIWAGAGVAMIAIIGWVIFGQTLDIAAIVGILCIVVGVIILNVFSTSVSH
ncbi:MAG: SMR family transporter [Oceanospirillaceae bacterium]